MLDTGFTFNDIRSKQIGLELQAPLVLSAAEPNVVTTTIPGRNGTLCYYDGSYKNRTLSGDCFILGEDVERKIGEINAWLVRYRGYGRIELDEDSEHYMLARSKTGIRSQIINGVLNACSVSFDCKPQRFLIYGEKAVDVTDSKVIYNPTAFPSLPDIIIEGNGDVSISTPLWSLSFKDLTGEVRYSSESYIAYNKHNEIFNNNTIVSGDILLNSGKTTFTTTGDVTSVKIIPRWWEI